MDYHITQVLQGVCRDNLYIISGVCQKAVKAEIIYRGIGNASRAQYFGWAVHIIHPTPCDSHLLGGRKKVGEEEKRRLSSHQNTICQRNRILSGMTHLCYHF